MQYIVYLTTNLVNNKIYIGVHKTENPEVFDGYIGNGVYINSPKTYNKKQTVFHYAICKYGVQNFKRITLKVFDNLEDALDLERWLVCPEFLKRSDVYNTTLGGSAPPVLNKNIYQYSIEGKFIKSWNSIKEITDFFEVNKDRVRMCINEQRSFHGSYWTETYHKNLDNILYQFRPSTRGSIKVYTIDGKYKGTYFTGKEVCTKFNITKSKLAYRLAHKSDYNGYYFLKEGEKIEDFLSGNIIKDKKIYQYDSKGNFIQEFDNIRVIKKVVTSINKSNLQRAIRNSILYENFYWSYDKVTKFNTSLENDVKQPIYQYTLDNIFIKRWESINECKKQYPSALQVCLGKRKHCHNFKFSFKPI